jgi:hypothetical protein
MYIHILNLIIYNIAGAAKKTPVKKAVKAKSPASAKKSPAPKKAVKAKVTMH